MAQHSEDGRVLAVDKRTGTKVREFPHIIAMAPNLEKYDSKRQKNTTTATVTEPQRTTTSGAAKKETK